MTIRKADPVNDYDKVWEIFSKVIKSGDTYVFDPATPKDALQHYWFGSAMETFVAVDDDGSIVGTYFIKSNQIDLGNHVANCGYMVNPDSQGRGIGKLLCAHSITYAKEKDYEAIQFNIVVSTNTTAVALWKKFGFEIIGTTPKGFRHREFGLVDTFIMYKDLSPR
jgi:L-amino acid N-acyltransferase YncA